MLPSNLTTDELLRFLENHADPDVRDVAQRLWKGEIIDGVLDLNKVSTMFVAPCVRLAARLAADPVDVWKSCAVNAWDLDGLNVDENEHGCDVRLIHQGRGNYAVTARVGYVDAVYPDGGADYCDAQIKKWQNLTVASESTDDAKRFATQWVIENLVATNLITDEIDL